MPPRPSHTHAIVVGIDHYDSRELPNLVGARNDAGRFTDWLQTRGVEHVTTLPDATRDQFENALSDRYQAEGDLLIVYWSGHGICQPSTGRRLLYSNATEQDRRNLDVDSLLSKLRSTHFSSFPMQLVVLDTCADYKLSWRGASELPSGRLQVGEPRAGVTQHALFAARIFQKAVEDRTREVGLLSDRLLARLGEDWPIDIEAIEPGLKSDFRELRDDGDTNQEPFFSEYCVGGESVWNDDSRPTGILREVDELDPALASISSAQLDRLLALLTQAQVGDETLRRAWWLAVPSEVRVFAGEHPDLVGAMARDLRLRSSPCLLRFCLALHDEIGEAHRAELMSWIQDDAAPVLGVDLQKVGDLRTEVQHATEAELHLLVRVGPAQHDDPEIAVWAVCGSGPAHRVWVRDAVPRAVSVPADVRAERAQVRALLRSLLNGLKTEIAAAGRDRVTVHLFVPLSWLDTDADQWPMDRPFSRTSPIGHRFRVVLRCWERWYDPELGDTWADWVDAWGRFVADPTAHWAGAHDLRDEDRLRQVLDDADVGFVALDSKPSDPIPILLAGAPVALWPRSEHQVRATLDDQLARDSHDVPGAILRARIQDEDLQLALMYDNPDFPPPDSPRCELGLERKHDA